MKIDPKLIIEACENANSMSEAATKFDINFQTFRKYAKQLGVWKTNQCGRCISKPHKEGVGKYPLQDILNGKYPYYPSSKLKTRLIREGLKESKCESCDIIDWNGKPLTMQLHHKDGNHYNQALENLEILCPNCHTQTDNHGNKKRLT